MKKTLAQASEAISQLTPEAQKTLAEVQRTLGRTQASLESLDKSITDPNAPVQRGLDDTLRELQRAAQSLRILGDYLQAHPESLLRGKPADPVLPSSVKTP
ncbi:MAG: hypothetical protein ABIV63_18615 [Caldimonas sp.]